MCFGYINSHIILRDVPMYSCIKTIIMMSVEGLFSHSKGANYFMFTIGHFQCGNGPLVLGLMGHFKF